MYTSAHVIHILWNLLFDLLIIVLKLLLKVYGNCTKNNINVRCRSNHKLKLKKGRVVRCAKLIKHYAMNANGGVDV
jgi:hypothetical protein